jgi:hypothetical protein
LKVEIKREKINLWDRDNSTENKLKKKMKLNYHKLILKDKIEKKKLNNKKYWVVEGWNWKKKYSIKKWPKK